MPSSVWNIRELPAAISETVWPDPSEKFSRSYDRPEPRLAGKQVIEGVLEHPHMDRVQNVRQFLERDSRKVWNLIHVTDHDDGLVRYVLNSTEDTLALVFFTAPWVLVFWRLFGRDYDVSNFREPLGIPLFVLFEEQLLWSAFMIHFGLDKYETIHVPIEYF
jgi:hypothetical protein